MRAHPLEVLHQGQRVGAYEVQRRLGGGGMGLVYVARHRQLEMDVALKVIRPDRTDSDQLRRFRRESELLSELHHPGIARLYSSGLLERSGETPTPYMAMELIEGPTLDESCRERNLSVSGKIALFRKALEGVQFAHQCGVIHLDLKPDHVRVNREGQPKILDFGLAKELRDDSTEASGGTWSYMSPERLEGRTDEIDIRSDIYSLGVMLLELIAGSETKPDVPFSRVIPSSVRGDLRLIVSKALQRDPRDRYQSIAEMADDLDRYLDHRPILARPTTMVYRLRKWSRRHRLIVALLVLFAISLIGGGFEAHVAHLEADQSATQAENERQTAERRHRELRRLADGRRLADLEAQAKTLWPAWPTVIPRMEDWLEAARILLAREPLHHLALWRLRLESDAVRQEEIQRERLALEIDPEDPARRARAQEYLKTIDQSFPSPRTEFDDQERQWEHDLLVGLLHDLRMFASPNGTFQRMLTRVDEARERETLEESHIDEWHQTIAAIRADERYGGLELSPQFGLVPLGRNEKTGWFEFWSEPSGTRPRWDADEKRWQMEETSGVVFILLPGGTVEVGAHWDAESPHFDPDAKDFEGPRRVVEIAPFFLSAFELTEYQWRSLRALHENEPAELEDPGDLPKDDISFDECRETLVGLGWTLPTEEEWEYALRGGCPDRWTSGPLRSDLQRIANVSDVSYGRRYGSQSERVESWDDGFVTQAPVGSFESNHFGFYDGLGNLWEWCRLRSDVQLEGRAVVRGGEFGSNALRARITSRGIEETGTKHGALGCRPSRALDPGDDKNR